MKSILEKKVKYLIPTQYKLTMYLLENGAKRRREIVKGLDLPRSTVYDNLKKLEGKGIVLRRSAGSTGEKGRPPILWQVEQCYMLVSFKQGRITSPKQPKPKNNKTTEKKKLPKWAKKCLLKEVKFQTYRMKAFAALEELELRSKKSYYHTNSYILTNKYPSLTEYILNEVNRCTYFNIHVLSKQYVKKILNIRYDDEVEKALRSTSNRIGRIVSELSKLGIVVKHTGTSRGAWRNLYKNELHATFNKIMEQKAMEV